MFHGFTLGFAAARMYRFNFPAISYQLSAISYQLSAISYQLSAISGGCLVN
jgi:hypothetical protein